MRKFSFKATLAKDVGTDAIKRVESGDLVSSATEAGRASASVDSVYSVVDSRFSSLSEMELNTIHLSCSQGRAYSF